MMRPQRLLLTLCLLLGAIQPSRGADDLAPIIARVARPDLLRGHFEQDKQVVGFRKPLRSAGHFVLARGRGILWWTERPFPSSLVVTNDHLIAETGGDRRRIDASDEPALRIINTMLFDVFGGDIARLQSGFAIAGEVAEGGRWYLRLTPKPGLFAQAFTRIDLEGGRYVDVVTLDERNGDRSSIRFSAFAEAPALDADEVARLAQ